MPEPTYIITAVLVCSAVTWALRAAPFAFLAPIRHSALLPYLNESMPVGVLTILVFYTLRHTPVDIAPQTGAAVAALVTTAALHVWRKNAVLSVVGGTAVHVAVASTLPLFS
ncbi:AzlD domain-containing protein [Kitasatospora atroaurantiaca]|uniref:Branched-subunit amino acid transport protein AzlD n=1 Tax=Kitasatospora atroaurantiaca TaxID=285545 RepID=A0A561EIN7_9ACTN|nr:AzlD domain-containing protein [Kitasatospora atroaurantiaca]TWE15474.1 branched-subunit amino acid transport protein AzlD [Kitasatospora atroaurantiaca]